MILDLLTSMLLAAISPATAAPQSVAEAPPLDVAWIHGQRHCEQDSDPAFQVFRLSPDTYILRQDKCLQYEAPFLYLLLGKRRALLLDTGSIEVGAEVGEEEAKTYPLRRVIDQILHDYALANALHELPLVVVHSHGHGDHVAGDRLFYARANTQVVDPGAVSVSAFWRFSGMHGPAVIFDLGDRSLDVLPLPGHCSDHIAIYDRHHALLLSGDSLYPGRLYIQDWAGYRDSIERLHQWIAERPLDYILGAHVEMSSKPGVDYPIGSSFQPNEHVLELRRPQLDELHTALRRIGTTPRVERHADFIIDP